MTGVSRVTVLTNPASGHGSAPHAAERAVAQLHRRGVDVVAIAGTDAEHARRLVDGALERGMDALVVVGGDGTDKWFGTVMAAGFDSLVTDRTNRMRWPHGRMRYNVAMVAELSKLRLLPFRLSFDGEEVVTDLTLAAFGNTKSYGGGMRICPNADPTDGLLDATMVASASRTKLIRLFPTVFKGTHVDLDEVRTARARA